MSSRLTPDDLTAAAGALACDLPAVKAVIAVESGGRGMGDDGRPIILFEPHVFSRLTEGRFDVQAPDISYEKWGALPYPKTQAEQWARLKRASGLDHEAALSATSWGLFQIMGHNAGFCGFGSLASPDVPAFTLAMARGEREQLEAFVAFLKAKGLDEPLRRHDWSTFARGYNGPRYMVNAYNVKLADAWRKAGGKET